MTATPASKGKDRTLSPGSEPDSAPDAVADTTQSDDAESAVESGEGTAGTAKKKTVAAGQKRDEVVVQVSSTSDDDEADTDFEAAGESDTTAATGNETVADLKVIGSVSAAEEKVSADPAWTASSEPAGSVFAGRTDSPPPSYTPPAPSPVPPPMSPPIGGERPNVVRGAGPVDGKSPRKAHLQVSRFEPLSVMKFSFVMSLVCFVVLLVAVTVLYVILSGLGVFDSISSTINELTQEQGSKSSGFDAASWFSFTKIFGYTALIGGLNVLIITALATVWSVIYNIAADFVGGVEVTLKEAE